MILPCGSITVIVNCLFDFRRPLAVLTEIRLVILEGVSVVVVIMDGEEALYIKKLTGPIYYCPCAVCTSMFGLPDRLRHVG